MKKMKKFLSLLLVVTMLISVLPTVAYAQESEPVSQADELSVSQPLSPNQEGVYELFELTQLISFAEKVNSGETAVNAKLMADIDITSKSDFTIGTKDNPFSGVFDGNGYTLTVNITSTEEAAAPFSYAGGVTIKNLTIAGTVATSAKYAGGFIGSTKGTVTFENCLSLVTINSSVDGDGTHGGFIGVVNENNAVTFTNCGFAGAINGEKTTSCGGLVGWLNALVTATNSFVAATYTISDVHGNAIARNDSYLTSDNVYYLNMLGGAPKGAQAKTEEQFASGEVAYLLNGKTSDGTWKQTLGTDKFPNFSGKSVYGDGFDCGGKPFSYNNESAGTVPKHKYNTNGICSVCDAYQPATLNSDGCYEIANAGQFLWFGEKINAEERSVNGKLVDDIDLSGIKYIPITAPYRGTFDGCGHKISNMNIPSEKFNYQGTIIYGYAGLFGGLGNNAIVKNFTLTGSVTCSADMKYVGGVAAYAAGGAEISNVKCYVDIKDGSVKNKAIDRVGGIVGQISSTPGSVVKDCSYYGNITLDRSSSTGGIVGYANGESKVLKCVNYGKINVNNGSHIGGVVGSLYNVTVENCMNYGSVEMHTHDCVGGVIGYASDTALIKSCANVGSVSGTSTASNDQEPYVSGILGYVNDNNFGGIVNSYNYGTLTASPGYKNCGAIIGWGRAGATADKLKNNYYLEGENVKAVGTTNDTTVTAASATASKFASGEIAYILNGEVTDGTQDWCQELTDNAKFDRYPVTSGKTVYKFTDCTGHTSYANSALADGEHNYDINGYCKVCAKKGALYLDYNSTTNNLQTKSTVATDVTADDTVWKSGFYVAKGDIIINSRVSISGDVKLILADGANLVVNGGIDVNTGNSFTVYAQSTSVYNEDGTLNTEKTVVGSLTAQNAPDGYAGIGSIIAIDENGDSVMNAGDIIINGGFVTAYGGGSIIPTNTTATCFPVGIGAGAYGGGITLNNFVKVTAQSSGVGTGGGGFGSAAPKFAETLYYMVSRGASLSELSKLEHTNAASAFLIQGDNTVVSIEMCMHDGTGSYTFSDDEYHKFACKWCGKESEKEKHNFNTEDGVCICGGIWEGTYLDYNSTTGEFEEKLYKTTNIYKNGTCSNTLYLSGWCVIIGNYTAKETVVTDNSDAANIILTDGCQFKATKGIGQSFNLYAQSQPVFSSAGKIDSDKTTTGKLTATGSVDDDKRVVGAAIGGYGGKRGGSVTINGGNVSATGRALKSKEVYFGSAGIGGSNGKAGCILVVNGGYVYAKGGYGAAGIGGGMNGSGDRFTINGGCVKAYGGRYGAGIGGGRTKSSSGSNGGTVTINDGYVYADGSESVGTNSYGGTGIGGGGTEDATKFNGGKGATLTINGGTVFATGCSRGIGPGYNGEDNGETTINDFTKIKVTGATYAFKVMPTIKSGLKFKVKNSDDYLRYSKARQKTVYCSNHTVTMVKCTEHTPSILIDYDKNTHKTICYYCGVSVGTEPHTYDDGKCKCGNYESCTGTGEVNDPYRIANSGQMSWFNTNVVSEGNENQNAILLANIKLESISVMLGSSDNPFTGTFDGNGYTITTTLTRDYDYVAPFEYVNGCTIKNLNITGEITPKKKFAASIVGCILGGDVTIENCVSTVVISSETGSENTDGTVSDGTHGGLVANAGAGTLKIKNCGFAGQINGESTNSCGGLIGWVGNDCTATIENSYVAASFTVSAENSNTFARNPSRATLTRCYYLNELGETPENAVKKTADAFASGEVAYILQEANGENLVWGQISTTDGSIPILTSTEDYRVLPVMAGGSTVNYSVLKKGETNGDGQVDVTDYQNAVNIALSSDNTKEIADKYDYNGDGVIDALDCSAAEKDGVSDEFYAELSSKVLNFEGMCYMKNVDINDDGVVDVLDLSAFERLLSGHRVKIK